VPQLSLDASAAAVVVNLPLECAASFNLPTLIIPLMLLTPTLPFQERQRISEGRDDPSSWLGPYGPVNRYGPPPEARQETGPQRVRFLLLLVAAPSLSSPCSLLLIPR
jgi:hypothetical protein